MMIVDNRPITLIVLTSTIGRITGHPEVIPSRSARKADIKAKHDKTEIAQGTTDDLEAYLVALSKPAA